MSMITTKKQIKHYRSVLQNGLDNFQRAVSEDNKDERYLIIITDWQNLIGSQDQIQLYANNIKNVSSLFGFGRVFGSN